MSSALHGYPTVRHVLPLAPPVAAEAFDLVILDPAAGPGLVPAGPLFRDLPRGYAALRKLPAGLRLTGRTLHTVPVVLELLPWSDRRTELAISTAARPHLFVERSVAAYLDVAHRYLAALGELMDARHIGADPHPPTGQSAAVRVARAVLPQPRQGRSGSAPKP